MILTTLLLYSQLINSAVGKSLTPSEVPTYFDMFGESGLINIPCEELTVVGGTRCDASNQATSISSADSTISHRFTGSKVYIVADLSQASTASADVLIDQEIVKTIDFSDASLNQLVFSSGELWLDEHEIIIHHKGPANSPIRIISLYIQPYSQHQGFSLGFDGLHDYIGDWDFLYPSKSDVSAFKSESPQAACTFKFYGTQFWLTGIQSAEYGNMILTIDYGEPKEIRKKTSNGNVKNSILLYESEVLTFKEHIVTINRLDGPIAIFKLLFTISPYLELPTYSKAPQSIPVSIPAANMTDTTDGLDEETPVACDSSYITPCGTIYKNTNSAEPHVFEYTFKGECFQVYGSKFNGEYDILLDGQLIQTVHQKDESNYHLDFTSEIYPYAEHTIKIKLYAGASIYKIAFWPSIQAKRIDITDFEAPNGEWKPEPDAIGGKRYDTNSVPNVKALRYPNLQASKIWMYGTKASYLKQLSISFADHSFQNDTADTKRIDFALVSELQFDQITKGTLEIRPVGGQVQLNYVYYIEEPLLCLPIFIPTSFMTVNTTSYQNSPGTRCGNEAVGFCGNYLTATEPTSFEYTFYGEMFQIFGRHSPDHKSYDIYLDNVYITTINQFNDRRSTGYVIDYLSNAYPYGKHTIRVEGADTFSIHKFAYWPSCKAKRINFTSFERDGWKTEGDEIGGIRVYADKSVKTANSPTFKANKIWIYGSKATWHKEASFSFSSYVSKQLNETLDGPERREDFVLIYETPYFAYREAKVTIRTTGTFTLNYIYYLDEPVSAIPILIPSVQTKTGGEPPCNTPTPCTTDINNFPCGVACQSNSNNIAFEYRFKGECFEVYGTHNNQLRSYNIYIDEILVYSPNQQIDSGEKHYSLDYASYILPYGWHTLKAEGDNSGSFKISSFAYWPSVNAKRINASDFQSSGSAKTQSDGIGGIGVYQEKNQDSTFSCDITFQKIWLYGTIASWHGDCTITLGDFEDHFSEKIPSGSEKFYLVYDSPLKIADRFEISDNTDNLNDATRYFHYVYYIDCDYQRIPTPSPTPSPTPVFSDSLTFTKSEDFSESSDFSRSESFSSSCSFSTSSYFSNSDSFTQSTIFSESLDFSTSLSFSGSLDFTDSNTIYVSGSFEFSASELFTKSSSFSKSHSFSKSDLFTKSESFTKSSMGKPSVPDGSDSNKKGAPLGLIIGLVVAIILLLVIIVLIILYMVKRRSKSPDDEQCSEMEASGVTFTTVVTQNVNDINDENSEAFDFFDGFDNINNVEMNPE